MTTRRGFLAALTAAAAGLLAGVRPARAAPTPKLRMSTEPDVIDVNLWFSRFPDCRVLLDGRDVTEDCFSACPSRGWVGLYVRTPDGGIVDVAGNATTTRKHGRVDIVRLAKNADRWDGQRFVTAE